MHLNLDESFLTSWVRVLLSESWHEGCGISGFCGDEELKPVSDFEVSALRLWNGIWPVINMLLLFSKDSLVGSCL